MILIYEEVKYVFLLVSAAYRWEFSKREELMVFWVPWQVSRLVMRLVQMFTKARMTEQLQVNNMPERAYN